MRRTLSAILAVALLATGCRFSKVDAHATVHISGRALGPSGAPLAGVQVRLFREADLGEALTGIVLAIGTLGTVCALPGAPAVCRQAHVATTDASGDYTFTLKGSDTQGTLGTESTLDVVVSGRGAGPASTTLSFPARSARMRLPDARLWQATPSVAETGGRVQLRWPGLPGDSGTGRHYFTELYDPARAAPVWSQPAGAHGGSVDARVLEDHAAEVAASARTSLGGATGTDDVHAAYLSSRVPVRPSAGAPPSRNRPCRAVSGTGPLVTTAQAHCPATDGDLLDPGRLTSAHGIVTGVVIDLGRPQHIHLLVLRGLSGSCLVELSRDGRSYDPVTLTNDSPAAVSPPGAPLARFVRVRAPSGLDESLMSEVSAW